MLTHPDKRTKRGIELAGGINRSDHALHLAQEAYKDALRWSIVKIIHLPYLRLRPRRRVRRARAPTPTESGPMTPLSSTTTPIPKASPPTLSQARDLRLRQEMLLRRELSLRKAGDPANPKAPPPTLSAEEKELLRREFGNGTNGADGTTRPHDATHGHHDFVPVVPKQSSSKPPVHWAETQGSPPTTAPTGPSAAEAGTAPTGPITNIAEASPPWSCYAG